MGTETTICMFSMEVLPLQVNEQTEIKPIPSEGRDSYKQEQKLILRNPTK
jgi:hypothetical protein